MLVGEPTHEILTAPAGPGGSAGLIVSRAPASWTAVAAAALPTRSGASDYFSTCGRNRRKLKSHGELASQRLSTQQASYKELPPRGVGVGGCRWHMAPQGPAGLSPDRCSLPSSVRLLSMLLWLLLWWVHTGAGTPGLWSAVPGTLYTLLSKDQHGAEFSEDTSLFNWKGGRVHHVEGSNIQ